MATSGSEPEPNPDSEMKVDPQRASQLSSNLSTISRAIQSANKANRPVRLVAVSKLKPASDVLALHTHSSTPHSHFGENYVQELLHKAEILPRTINWHFIGALQTNKCKPLAEQIPNLWAVESVDTVKKADALEKGRAAFYDGKAKDGEGGESVDEENKRLRVFVQVNTSGEESKSGVSPGEETVSLCKHILDSCPHLKLQGLMTIGAIARSQAAKSGEENEDFVALKGEKEKVVKELGIEELELSMGMSADFEDAIGQGSDEVRVGSEIFGARLPKGGGA